MDTKKRGPVSLDSQRHQYSKGIFAGLGYTELGQQRGDGGRIEKPADRHLQAHLRADPAHEFYGQQASVRLS